MHVCMYACMHACMHVCMYVCIDTFYIYTHILHNITIILHFITSHYITLHWFTFDICIWHLHSHHITWDISISQLRTWRYIASHKMGGFHAKIKSVAWYLSLAMPGCLKWSSTFFLMIVASNNDHKWKNCSRGQRCSQVHGRTRHSTIPQFARNGWLFTVKKRGWHIHLFSLPWWSG